MWRTLSLALALSLLVGARCESEGGGTQCAAPPGWKIGEAEPLKDSLGSVTVVAFFQASCWLCLMQASRLVDLRQKLDQAGLVNVTYMVVNSQDNLSRRLHDLLEKRLAGNIALYGQDLDQDDAWKSANAQKDDIHIYDRCGRLAYNLSLPYTILTLPYVEDAIRKTYCDGICGSCELESTDRPAECNRTNEEKTKETETPVEDADSHHHHEDHHHGHHGGHHHHHGGHHHGRHHGHHHHGHHGGQQFESRERHSHHHGHEEQFIIGQVPSGHLDIGQKDLGQVSMSQVDLDHVTDDVENRQVMRRP